MSLLPFLKLSMIAALGACSPGPDFLLVARSSLSHGRRSGLATACGLATGILTHSTYCILGLALLLANSPQALHVMQWGGAIYLAYLGIKCLRSGGNQVSLKATGAPSSSSLGADFARGLACNLLNPKATLFILSIFTQFVDPGTGWPLQALYALNLAGVTLAWFGLLSWCIAWPPVRQALLRWQGAMDRAFGVLLLALAAAIVLR